MQKHYKNLILLSAARGGDSGLIPAIEKNLNGFDVGGFIGGVQESILKLKTTIGQSIVSNKKTDNPIVITAVDGVQEATKMVKNLQEVVANKDKLPDLDMEKHTTSALKSISDFITSYERAVSSVASGSARAAGRGL